MQNRNYDIRQPLPTQTHSYNRNNVILKEEEYYTWLQAKCECVREEFQDLCHNLGALFNNARKEKANEFCNDVRQGGG